MDIHCHTRVPYITTKHLQKFSTALLGRQQWARAYRYSLRHTSDIHLVGSRLTNYANFVCSVTRSSTTFSIAFSHTLMSDWRAPLNESPFGAEDVGVFEATTPAPM